MKNKITFHIIANAALGASLSGGDRIFIECARRWAAAGHKVHVYAWEEGYAMCKRNRLDDARYVIWSASRFKRFGFFTSYLARTINGCKQALKLDFSDSDNTIVYSASDFWPDLLPALILKLKFKNRIKWVAGFYLLVPNPLSKDSFYVGTRRLKALLYYISQKFSYPLVKRYTDMVFVTNNMDRCTFVGKRLEPEAVIAVQGGVDTKIPSLVPEPKLKTYDAIFIGRLCLEKGVRELIDIWKHVCDRKKNAKLTLLGAGPLEAEIMDRIAKHNLENNVELFGFVDGIRKFQIIKKSKVVVHPSIIDSGGMAACEAMVCGLPGVSFDLPTLRSYYPKGMIKTPCYDLKGFAENLLKLLDDKGLYKKMAKDALDLAMEWDWDKRATALLESMSELFIGTSSAVESLSNSNVDKHNSLTSCVNGSLEF